MHIEPTAEHHCRGRLAALTRRAAVIGLGPTVVWSGLVIALDGPEIGQGVGHVSDWTQLIVLLAGWGLVAWGAWWSVCCGLALAARLRHKLSGSVPTWSARLPRGCLAAAGLAAGVAVGSLTPANAAPTSSPVVAAATAVFDATQEQDPRPGPGAWPTRTEPTQTEEEEADHGAIQGFWPAQSAVAAPHTDSAPTPSSAPTTTPAMTPGTQTRTPAADPVPSRSTATPPAPTHRAAAARSATAPTQAHTATTPRARSDATVQTTAGRAGARTAAQPAGAGATGAISAAARAWQVARSAPDLPAGLGAVRRTQVTVRPGDTLWSVAAAHLGGSAGDDDIAQEWPRWYQTNRDVIGADPDLLLPGTTLLPPTI
jgi:hypothetical protein